MSPALARYPRPHVAVDIAVLTVPGALTERGGSERSGSEAGTAGPLRPIEPLSVLVLRRDEEPTAVLPGRFIRERETIAETIRAILALKLGLEPGHFSPTLLRVFDDPQRDARGWTLSLAHAVTVPASGLEGCTAELLPIGPEGDIATGESLGYDHDQIVRAAVSAIRDRYELAPDPDGLLGGPFTLSELRRLHESVLGARLRKDTFNRRMQPQLEKLYDGPESPSLRRSVGRPAQLYVRPGRDTLPRERWELPRA